MGSAPEACPRQGTRFVETHALHVPRAVAFSSMKTLLRLLPLFALISTVLRGAESVGGAGPHGPGNSARHALLAPAVSDQLIAAVKAADEERVAATRSGDRARLEAILSDELRYAHSSGHADTKASYIKSLTTRSSVYESYDYLERTFLPAAPGIVLMTGRVLVRSRNGEQKSELDLNFLAVWREENGRWRFLAWQSCKNAPVEPAAKN